MNQPDNANQQMMRVFAQWARSKGIKKPSTPEGMRVLMAQFINEFTARAQQVIGAAGDTTYNSDPIAVRDRPLQIVRDDGGMIDVADVETEDSDFTDLVRDRERALQDAGGDDLAAEEIFRSRARTAVAEEPHTRNPVSAEGAALGSAIQVKSGTVAASAPTVANWSDKDAKTRQVAISFAMAPVSPTFGAFAVKPFGIVQFGTAGYLASFEVDIGTGCIFSVPASQVLLSVGNDVEVSPESPSTLLLSGMLSFDPVFHSTPMTRTIYIENVPASSNSANIPIKPFAKNVRFWRAALSTGPVTLQFNNSALQTLYSISIAANATLNDSIPLANDVTTIVIANGDGANALTHCRLIFELAI